MAYEQRQAKTVNKPIPNLPNTKTNLVPVKNQYTTNLKSGWIIVGKFGRTHGLHGTIFVHSFTDPAKNLFAYKPLQLIDQTPLPIISHQPHAKQFIVTISQYHDCNTVRTLTNQFIYLHQEHLPKLPSGQYYWHQLVGCDVINQDNHCFGRVDYVHAGPQFPILIVKHPKNSRKPEHLIPYEPSTVISVSIDQQIIVVNWISVV